MEKMGKFEEKIPDEIPGAFYLQ